MRNAIVFAMLLTACGSQVSTGSSAGGGGAPSTSGSSSTGSVAPAPAPRVELVFPAVSSTTDRSSLTVRGIGEGLAGVRVAGVAATSDDGFSTWAATVPLEVGDVDLPIEMVSVAGEVLPGPVVPVRRTSAVWLQPSRLAVSRDGEHAYVFDGLTRHLYEVDLGTGARRLIPLDEPLLYESLAVDDDGNRILAYYSSRFFEIDIATGAKQVLADWGPLGYLGTTDAHSTFAIDPILHRALFVRSKTTAGSLVEVDLETGATQELPVTGLPKDLDGVLFDETTNHAYVLAGESVIEVDMQNLLAAPLTPATGADPWSHWKTAVLDSTTGTILYPNGLRYDVATETVSTGPAPSGYHVDEGGDFVDDVVWDAAGNRLVGVHERAGVFAVDAATMVVSGLSNPFTRPLAEQLLLDRATFETGPDGSVYAASKDALSRLDLRSGEVMWTTTPSLPSWPDWRLLRTGGGLALINDDLDPTDISFVSAEGTLSDTTFKDVDDYQCLWAARLSTSAVTCVQSTGWGEPSLFELTTYDLQNGSSDTFTITEPSETYVSLPGVDSYFGPVTVPGTDTVIGHASHGSSPFARLDLHDGMTEAVPMANCSSGAALFGGSAFIDHRRLLAPTAVPTDDASWELGPVVRFDLEAGDCEVVAPTTGMPLSRLELQLAVDPWGHDVFYALWSGQIAIVDPASGEYVFVDPRP